MAVKKKNGDEELDSGLRRNDGIEEAPAVEATAGKDAGAINPPAGDYCVLVNLGTSPLDCPLRTGRNIHLGPRVHGLNIHRSEPVLKKDRTEILFTWERMGKLAFENLSGGESA